MKKLLVIALSVVMVFAFAAVSVAEVKATGQVQLKYNTSDEDGVDDYDEFEIYAGVEGNINDSVSGKVVFRADLGHDTVTTSKTTENGDDTYSDVSSLNKDVYADEYWINIANTWGNIKLGYWDLDTDGERDIVSGAFGDINSDVAIDYTFKVENFYGGLWYSANECDDEEGVGDGAYVVTLGYGNEKVGIEGNFVDTAIDTEGYDTGYTANLYFAPVESVKFYTTYGVGAASDDTYGVFGAKVTGGPWVVRAEYGYGDDSTNGSDYGVQVYYNAANGITYRLTHAYDDSADVTTDQIKAVLVF